MSEVKRDARTDPRVGDTAESKAGSLWTIVSINRHINSEDIAYLRLRSQKRVEKSVIMYEWMANFVLHKAGEEA